MRKLIERYDKFIRVITIAPVIALALLLALYFAAPEYGICLLYTSVN